MFRHVFRRYYWYIFLICLSVLGTAVYFIAIYFIVSNAVTREPMGSIPLEWYTAKPRIESPRFFTPQDALEEIPNLPVAYLDSHFSRGEYNMSQTCALYPDAFKLSFHNLYWQSFSSAENNWYLMAAYYENRALSNVKPAIRLLVVMKRFDKKKKPFCQIWFPGHRQPVIVSSHNWEWVLKFAKIYLVTCPIPAKNALLVPGSVSLVQRYCDTATNHLKVVYNKAEKKQDFGVCVTLPNFIGMDYSVRIAEWIELVHLLGAHQIFLYYHYHHENVTKVLKHYEREGKIQLHRYSLPGDQPNLPIVQKIYLTSWGAYLATQFVGLQDCFYRNMYNYNYLTAMDIDEVIIPQVGSTWNDLMENITSDAGANVNSFCVENFWFHDDDTQPAENFSDVPTYLHMLRHVHRSQSATGGKYGVHEKCFHKPEYVMVEGNHGSLRLFVPKKVYRIPPGKARLQHYCDHNLKNRCKGMSIIADTSIWKYKKDLIERVLPTLNQLGFLRL